MKKRIRVCTLLLAVCLLISVLSFAQAEDNSEEYVRVTNDTVETAKNVTANGDGTYTITLEAWATGQRTTTTITQAKPMDIILVIDRSGSMKGDKGTTLQQTLTGENGFLDTVAEKSPKSRVAIVSYASSASIDSGTKTANGALVPISDNLTTLKSAINGLAWNGATNAHLGLQNAANIFQSVPADDPNYSNERLVIFLTDGIPGSGEWGISGLLNSDSFDSAQKSIHIAHIIKNAKGEQTSIDFTQYFCHSDSACSQDNLGVTSLTGCGAKIYSVGISLPDNDNKINEYMYRVSSHRPDGSHVGCSTQASIGHILGHNVERVVFNSWEEEIPCWYANYPDDHTRNKPSADASNNYYMEGDPSALAGFFGTIGSSVTQGGASDETLTGDTTCIQDVITPYFTIPNGANSVSWHTESFTGNDSWTNNNDTSTTGITVNGNTVRVSGFNFSENWVGTDNGTPRGKKLVISIVIKPTDSFLGGDNVPTNVDSQAGMYHDSSMIENFPNENAKADVPVRTITPDVQDQTIYLSNSTELSGLLKSFDSRIDGLNNDYADVTYTLSQSETTIGTYTVTKGNTTGTWAGTLTATPTDCSSYTVTCTVNGGTNNTSTGTGNAKVHVLKPTITAADKTIYLSQEIGAANVTITGWGCDDGKTEADAVGTAPAISGVTVQQGTTARETSYVPDTCGEYTVVWNLGGTNFTADYTVHVLKPTISTTDAAIYLGNQTDLSDRVTVENRWTCVSTHATGSTIPAAPETKPTVNLSYAVGTTPVTGADKFAPKNCTYVQVTPTVGSKVLTAETFTIHVLTPNFTVATNDVWADYGTSVDLTANCLGSLSVSWGDKNSHDLSKITKIGTEPSITADNCTFTFGSDSSPYTVTDQDKQFSVTGISWKVDNTTTIVFDSFATAPAPFTVHPNRYNLTINKTWSGNSAYYQDAIFDVTIGSTTMQVVIPAGQNSVTVHDILCTSDAATVKEDTDWSWRWTSDGQKTASHVQHTEISKTKPTGLDRNVSFTNTLSKNNWLSGNDCVINMSGHGQTFPVVEAKGGEQ